MTLNKKRLFFARILVVASLAFLALGCAVQNKPQGGPRDVTPPKLLKATPANQTHNFSAKSIQLDFDEYFKPIQYQEVNISPNQDTLPEFKIKQKSLIINFKSALKKNTTYVINFGKAIADLHEGNILKNFTYVFSTGNHIDSLSISGNVTNALTQTKEKDVTVMLLTPKEDSLYFGKKKPAIYTTTDTSGNFTLTNLHEGVYKLYALKEPSPNKIYDNDAELVGIPNKTINLQVDTTGVQLKLFKQIPAKFKFSEHKFDFDGKMILTFNRPVEKPTLRIIFPELQNQDKRVEISKTRDTALLYVKNMDFDSLKVALLENNKPIDTVTLRKQRKESYVRILTAATNADTRGLLKPGIDLAVTTNSPITSYEQSLIVLNEDSTIVTDYTIQQDTSNAKRLTLKYKWKQGANYMLTFNENALTGYFGEKNKKIIKRFKIDKPDNYSQLTLHITVPDTAKAYIIEFYDEKGLLLRSDNIRKSGNLVYKSYLTGKYNVRVVYDDNKNGKWDTGSIKDNRQPENVWVDKEIIALRPSWEADTYITIPREPIP